MFILIISHIVISSEAMVKIHFSSLRWKNGSARLLRIQGADPVLLWITGSVWESKNQQTQKIGREVKNSPIISIIAFMLLKNFYIVIKITLCQSNVSNNTCHVCTHTWLPEIRQPNTLMHCLV